MPYDAFISYSHAHKAIVQPIAQLLSIDNRRVFTDTTIPPGVKWHDEINGAIQDSRFIVLLWCCDAANSDYVNNEIKIALSMGKSLVPVLLCGYPVPHPVSEWQWIDLTKLFPHTCILGHPFGPTPGAPSIPTERLLKFNEPKTRPETQRVALLKDYVISTSIGGQHLAWTINALLNFDQRVGIEQIETLIPKAKQQVSTSESY